MRAAGGIEKGDKCRIITAQETGKIPCPSTVEAKMEVKDTGRRPILEEESTERSEH